MFTGAVFFLWLLVYTPQATCQSSKIKVGIPCFVILIFGYQKMLIPHNNALNIGISVGTRAGMKLRMFHGFEG